MHSLLISFFAAGLLTSVQAVPGNLFQRDACTQDACYSAANYDNCHDFNSAHVIPCTTTDLYTATLCSKYVATVTATTYSVVGGDILGLIGKRAPGPTAAPAPMNLRGLLEKKAALAKRQQTTSVCTPQTFHSSTIDSDATSACKNDNAAFSSACSCQGFTTSDTLTYATPYIEYTSTTTQECTSTSYIVKPTTVPLVGSFFLYVSNSTDPSLASNLQSDPPVIVALVSAHNAPNAKGDNPITLESDSYDQFIINTEGFTQDWKNGKLFSIEDTLPGANSQLFLRQGSTPLQDPLCQPQGADSCNSPFKCSLDLTANTFFSCDKKTISIGATVPKGCAQLWLNTLALCL